MPTVVTLCGPTQGTLVYANNPSGPILVWDSFYEW